MKTEDKHVQFAELDNCLHCEIVDLIGERLAHGEDLTVEDVVSALVTTLAEFLATRPDRRTRRTEAKMIAEGIASLTEVCRREGQYPGGPNYGQTLPEPNADAPKTVQ